MLGSFREIGSAFVSLFEDNMSASHLGNQARVLLGGNEIELSTQVEALSHHGMQSLSILDGEIRDCYI